MMSKNFVIWQVWNYSGLSCSAAYMWSKWAGEWIALLGFMITIWYCSENEFSLYSLRAQRSLRVMHLLVFLKRIIVLQVGPGWEVKNCHYMSLTCNVLYSCQYKRSEIFLLNCLFNKINTPGQNNYFQLFNLARKSNRVMERFLFSCCNLN